MNAGFIFQNSSVIGLVGMQNPGVVGLTGMVSYLLLALFNIMMHLHKTV